MGQDGGLLFWGVIIVAMVVFMFLPQWTARRRQKRREEELAVGQRIVTIGGFIGDLTHLDFEANEARIRLADGVELSILPGAIRGKYEPVGGPADGGEEDNAPPSDTDADTSA
ncbi:MAG: preprotein translocase subunit YajC [Anaerolineae bacterium]|nr:preprotein translocase subunit YajC [Anaerolineae bacterium]